ncbi:LysR family transcriptional regulator [Helicobacter sp. 11S03491-1]|uniref:winged helix-turn-helix domain-containing protein n=1 Tax=Helicobacter sp. 11S03491-1 TaxID=1476196 RepID=UPI000BA59B04|nr:LysR family transcriptional regulator [Helicobacter sp. 11S03491-1]PAF43825.1 molybdenum transporter [Helicobacter sp. 11S03491-1]
MKVKIKIWLEDEEEKMVFGDGKANLLLKIDELGSISKAALACGLDYKKAWNHINVLENNIKENIIIRKKGGRDGGGSELTLKGRELVSAYKKLREVMNKECQKYFEKIFDVNF